MNTAKFEDVILWRIVKRRCSNYLLRTVRSSRKNKIMKEFSRPVSPLPFGRERESEVVSRFYRVLPSTRPGDNGEKNLIPGLFERQERGEDDELSNAAAKV